MKQREFLYFAGGKCKTVQLLWKAIWHFFMEINITLTIKPKIPFQHGNLKLYYKQLLSKSLENHDISMKFHIMTITTQHIRTYGMLQCPKKKNHNIEYFHQKKKEEKKMN